MIAYLKGKVIDIVGDSLIILNNGIGWDVKVSFDDVLIDQELELFIHTQMRESDITLWGFKAPIDLKLFRMLIAISGVGGKTAMAILRERGVNGVIDAILQNDAKALKVSGVGAKTAEKIIIEIKDKIENLNVASEGRVELLPSSNMTEAIQALESLGYRSIDITKAINSLDKRELEGKSVQEIVKAILKVI